MAKKSWLAKVGKAVGAPGRHDVARDGRVIGLRDEQQAAVMGTDNH